MAKPLTDLQRYALLGAQARLQQLQEETANIYRTFPQLRSRNGSVGTSTPSESDGPATKRRRGRMSAAQRKAVGERMKKYWAARRAAANGTATSKESLQQPELQSARRKDAERQNAPRRQRSVAPGRCPPRLGRGSPTRRRHAGPSRRVRPPSKAAVLRPCQAPRAAKEPKSRTNDFSS